MSKISRLLTFLGFDLRRTRRVLRGYPRYLRELRQLRALQRATGADDFPLGRRHPCLFDWESTSGTASGHYFHQDLLVARRIFEANPALHADVGSRVDGFVAHVASFRPIHVFDIRPIASTIPNVTFVQADMMSPVRPELRGYCESLSCLHALEHFGLGRYGDPVNPRGDALGLENLHAMLRPGGRLYLSVPIGPQRIEFNAHRIYSVQALLGRLSGRFALDRFSYVDDRGDLHEDVPVTDADAARSFGCSYGCGIFELTKRS